MKKMLVAMYLATAAMTAHAELSYHYVEASLLRLDFEDIPGFKPFGFEIEASYSVGKHFFARVNYADASDTNADAKFSVDQWLVTAGYLKRLSQATVIDLQLGYGDIELKGRSNRSSGSADSQFFTSALNVRHMLGRNIEMFGGLEWQRWNAGSDQKAYTLGARYHFEPLSFGLEYTKFSDSEWFGLSTRWSF